ncbi:hypothetical protein C8Q72DRAFT_274954 [Fomitopsis betulina]|nr:hypothetical protein C8Q72DRAFT_274954 [Fomitopsis betulina]
MHKCTTAGAPTCPTDNDDLLCEDTTYYVRCSFPVIFLTVLPRLDERIRYEEWRYIHERRLSPAIPSSGFDIIEDMKALLSFLASPMFSEDLLPSGITLDASRIALVGASGGAYPAMAAGLYAHPKPKALLLLFGMGGDMLGDGWVKPKDGFMPFPGSERATEASLSHLLNHPPARSTHAVQVRPDGSRRRQPCRAVYALVEDGRTAGPRRGQEHLSRPARLTSS